MPDTDINAGNAIRFENGGKLRIFNVAGSTSYNVLLLESGTLEIDDADTEGIPIMDRGRLIQKVLDGDERASMIRVRAKCTKLGLTGATELRALVRPSASGGLKQLFNIEIDIPDARSTAGTRISAASCWVPEPIGYRAGGAGQNVDTIDITFRVEGGEVTAATY